jgi:head-tail adaptor
MSARRRAPRLERLMLLEAPQDVADGSGGHLRGWVLLGTLWVALQPGSGRMLTDQEAPLARQRYRARMRAAPAGAADRPRPGQRLREGDRSFAILSVADEPGGRFLLCQVEEETGA